MAITAIYNYPVCTGGHSSYYVMGGNISPDGVWLAASEGTRVAPYYSYGVVYLFKKIAGAWIYQGYVEDTINGSIGSYLGYSVSFNNDATLMIAGMPGWHANDYGCVNIYSRSGDVWTHIDTLYNPSGDSYRANFGETLSISPDGTKLVITTDGDNFTGAKICTYVWNGGTSTWDFVNSKTFDHIGWSSYDINVALNYDGTILVVGEEWQEQEEEIHATGQVSIYDWNAGTSSWDKRFSFISPNPIAFMYFGRKVAVNYTGTYVAVSEDKIISGDSIGRIHLYKVVNDTATLLTTIDAPITEDPSVEEFGRQLMGVNGSFSNLVASPYRDGLCAGGIVYDYSIVGVPNTSDFWCEEDDCTEIAYTYGP